MRSWFPWDVSMTAMQECAGKSVWLCRGLWQGDCGSVYSREGGRVLCRVPLWRLCLGHTKSPQQFTVAYIKVLVIYAKHLLNSNVLRRLNLHLWRILVMRSSPACVWWVSPSEGICFRFTFVTTAQLWGTLSCCFMLRCIHTPPRIPVHQANFLPGRSDKWIFHEGRTHLLLLTHTREGAVWRQVPLAIWICKWLFPLFWWSHRDFESQGKHSI